MTVSINTSTSPLSSAQGGTGVNNNPSTITLAGNLVTSGANPLTLTTTGSTNVTLPTSGTLAVTSQIPSLPLSAANGGTGINNGSNTLTLAASTSIGSKGLVTSPAIPAFYATLSSNQSNVTGDGTREFYVCDTVVLNNGSAYDNTTGKFTAPVAGLYIFYASVFMTSVPASTFTILQFEFVLNNATTWTIVDSGGIKSGGDDGNNFIMTGSSLINLALNDFVQISVVVSGGTKSVGIQGAPRSSFGGILLA